jgi:diguanylate cyclase (GGDEF)-like protein
VGFKSIINDLTKSLKRMILVNMFVLTLIVPFVLLALGFESSKVALVTAIVGFTLCAANFFFVSSYFVRKTESTLTSSYESMHNDYLFDELTKVYNRRAGLIRLGEEFSRAKRNNSTFSLAMVDADFFKKINDNYGHLAGDKILTHIASTLKSGMRESDIVARYGGEEFLIILPETSGTAATLPLDRLRSRLARHKFDYNGTLIPVSISIGIATFSSNDEDPLEVVHRADNALYAAKKSGRNRVVNGKQHHNLSPSLSHAL